eukprot:3285566-Pleurochrysis_carterae.AAC.1
MWKAFNENLPPKQQQKVTAGTAASWTVTLFHDHTCNADDPRLSYVAKKNKKATTRVQQSDDADIGREDKKLLSAWVSSRNLPRPSKPTKILLATSNYRTFCRSSTDTLRTCPSTLRGLY